MTLVVMAAGMGSRYGGLKQLDPVGPGGEFIIDYAVYDAIKAGFTKVVFIIKEENFSLFKDTVGNRISGHINVEYAFQKIDNIPKGYKIPETRSKPWGTGHAVLSAKKFVDESFAVINADDFYGRESFYLIAEYLKKQKDTSKAHFCMAGFVIKNTLTENGHVARGICETNKDGNLINITERTKIMRIGRQVQFFEEETGWTAVDENTTVSMNCWGFEKSFFSTLEKGFTEFLESNKNDLSKCEYYLPSAVKESMISGESDVKVLITNAKWYGVTYREDRDTVVSYIKNQVEKGIYPRSLWN
ncbi:MAG: nucleotidyltransferase [Clostridiales bacterium GWF2_36_10]|nr:MAG: nucleotidyltransferase [Clostridiales bacterium GWF2_36_10]HAN20922.1 nucleotidyltransferase [Clostridiales bacterium]